MTIKYSENIKNIAGLQADSRRDRGDRVELVDQLLDIIRELPVREREVVDLQGYYAKTIKRNTAFHGVSGKIFSFNTSKLELLVTWSQDCQYPLQAFLYHKGYIVANLYTFKQTKASYEALMGLTADSLKASFDSTVEKYRRNHRSIKKALWAIKTKHFRYFRNACLNVWERFN